MTDMIPILIPLGAFVMVWGLRYLKNKESMAMIEKGIAPAPEKKESNPLTILKWGLIVCGVGIGLLFAFYITTYVLFTNDEQSTPIYFGLIAIFGGLGLIASYVVERNHQRNKPQ